VAEYPVGDAFKEAAFRVGNALYVIARVGQQQIGNAGIMLGCVICCSCGR